MTDSKLTLQSGAQSERRAEQTKMEEPIVARQLAEAPLSEYKEQRRGLVYTLLKNKKR